MFDCRKRTSVTDGPFSSQVSKDRNVSCPLQQFTQPPCAVFELCEIYIAYETLLREGIKARNRAACFRAVVKLGLTVLHSGVTEGVGDSGAEGKTILNC